ncbi:hypothetical protein B4096_2687 [Heyndrickxia coagulans]|nr:hypothetical protein B4100_3050 [Heyndrickxia coagulans]KYC91732.1 hypothetical protein B4096_2687 [Heyndrickxia coagulans]
MKRWKQAETVFASTRFFKNFSFEKNEAYFFLFFSIYL